MKKPLLVVFGIAAMLFALSGAVHAKGDVNDFSIASFDAQYTLSRDANNRSVLKTVETIEAEFPSYDQNHGVERALPEEYDGHTVGLVIDSVTDERGQPQHYTTYEQNKNMVVRIGDADRYVHGKTTYIITYTQHDATKFFKDTNRDELYWDVNGTEWSQTMRKVSATLHIDASLAALREGMPYCYEGNAGSTKQCVSNDKGQVVSFTSDAALQAGQTLTMAVGFKPDTFAPYEPTFQEKLWQVVTTIWWGLFYVTLIAALVAVAWMFAVWARARRVTYGHDIIVPEYIPPKDTSVYVSAAMANRLYPATTALILDLAVRHYIKIYQTKEKAFLQQAEYELEIVKTDGLMQEEQQLLNTLFGKKSKTPGARFALKELRTSNAMREKLQTGRMQVYKMTRSRYKLFTKDMDMAVRIRHVSKVVFFVSLFTLSPPLLVASIVGYILAYDSWVPTEKGVKLRNYLAGLEMYVRVAEKDRIKMLQSPEGAEKVGTVNAGDTRKLVKLYERVLPYAVLFGMEKEWLGQLGAYYEAVSDQPYWYVGPTVFNAAVFAQSIHTLDMQSSMYSSPSSSSSGGSGGGGSAGGGGGGGGGGGW